VTGGAGIWKITIATRHCSLNITPSRFILTGVNFKSWWGSNHRPNALPSKSPRRPFKHETGCAILKDLRKMTSQNSYYCYYF